MTRPCAIITCFSKYGPVNSPANFAKDNNSAGVATPVSCLCFALKWLSFSNASPVALSEDHASTSSPPVLSYAKAAVKDTSSQPLKWNSACPFFRPAFTLIALVFADTFFKRSNKASLTFSGSPHLEL